MADSKKLKSHSDKTAELKTVFASVNDALKEFKKSLGKKNYHSDCAPIQNISDSYWKPKGQNAAKLKIALGEFLADIGFAAVVKDAFLKLQADFPKILSYDREKETKTPPSDAAELKKAQDYLNVMMICAINYTDLCDAMNLAFNEAGLVPILVAAVEKLKDCTKDQRKYMEADGSLSRKTTRGSLLSRTLGTLHNMSKRVPTRANFHVCNAVKVVLPLIKDKVPLYATKALLVLAYLIDEENNNLIMASKEPIKFLVSLIDKSNQSSNHRFGGFSNTELAEGLAQIAINDTNKKQIVASGAIPVLARMIKGAKSEEEEKAAAEAMWVLAFDEENKKKMKSDQTCMDMLYKLKESKNKRTKKAASGALWEIEGKQQHASSEKASKKEGKPSATKKSSATTNHVMISYQWDVQNTLIQVKDRLQAAGYRVWMDLEQMGGSTLEAMAKAVENSAVVLICVSQKYKESSNCRSEAEYAFQLRKDIVPLMMDRNYKPDGWLGMIMGSKLWFDFSQQSGNIDSSMKALQKELGDRGKGDRVQAKSADVVDAKPTTDIRGWSKGDIKKWMKGFGSDFNKKNPGVADKLSGPTLKRLRSLKQESPDFYYASLKNDIGLSDVFDVMLFTEELEKLAI